MWFTLTVQPVIRLQWGNEITNVIRVLSVALGLLERLWGTDRRRRHAAVSSERGLRLWTERKAAYRAKLACSPSVSWCCFCFCCSVDSDSCLQACFSMCIEIDAQCTHFNYSWGLFVCFVLFFSFAPRGCKALVMIKLDSWIHWEIIVSLYIRRKCDSCQKV